MTSDSIRFDSFKIIFKNISRDCSSFFAPSIKVSANPLIEVIGVLSSCETFATNSRLKFSNFFRLVISCNTTTIPWSFFFDLLKMGIQETSKYFWWTSLMYNSICSCNGFSVLKLSIIRCWISLSKCTV